MPPVAEQENFSAQIGDEVARALEGEETPQQAPPSEAPPPLEETVEETPAEEAPPAEESPAPADEAPAEEEPAPAPTDAQAYIEALARPVDQGGIGHVPTAEETAQYYRAYVDQQLFDSDVEAGDPQGRLVGHILNSPNAHQIISRIPVMLERSNPQLLQYISRPILGVAANSLWEQMRAAPKGELKESLYQAAQHLHYELHGKYRDKGDAEPNAAPSDRERELTERERAFSARLRQESQRAGQAVYRSLLGGSLNALGGEIEKALAPAKNLPPLVYEGIRDKFTQLIMSRVQSNPEGWKLFTNSIASAMRSNDPGAAERVRDHYLRLARPEIAAVRGEFLKNAGVTIKAASTARHAQLTAAAQQKSPNGAPAPVKRSVEKPPPKAAMTDSEFRDQIRDTIAAELGA